MTRVALTAERVWYGRQLSEGAALVVDGARIETALPITELPAGLPLRDLGPGRLVPGFIDVQVNGGGGVLFNDTPTVEGVRKIAEAHRRFGTTGLLPTVITDAPEVMHAAAEAVSQAIKEGVPGVLGIHIEGPFIDVKRKGAHPEQFIRKPTDADIDWLCGLDCGKVLVTVAPNVVTPAHVRRLAEAGVIVSLGHSDATAEEALAALDAGAKGFTHLFNAMSQMTGRAPGMVGAALASRNAMAGIIADGKHVHPTSLRVVIEAKQFGGLFLISDAMPSAAGGPRRFALQGRPVEVVDGQLQLADGTLAGANITMLDAVKYLHRNLGYDFARLLPMATDCPAVFLGLHNEVSLTAKGYRANLVHLSNDLDVLETWIDGVSDNA